MTLAARRRPLPPIVVSIEGAPTGLHSLARLLLARRARGQALKLVHTDDDSRQSSNLPAQFKGPQRRLD